MRLVKQARWTAAQTARIRSPGALLSPVALHPKLPKSSGIEVLELPGKACNFEPSVELRN